MRILGIDPGIAIVGYGVVDKEANRYKTVAYDAITTKAHTPLEERLNLVYKGVCEVIDLYKPEAMAIEELFFNNNAKTALTVHGIIRLVTISINIFLTVLFAQITDTLQYCIKIPRIRIRKWRGIIRLAACFLNL